MLKNIASYIFVDFLFNVLGSEVHSGRPEGQLANHRAFDWEVTKFLL
jgi:hypothetical protein